MFEDETELGVTLKLVEHLKNIPETEHLVQLAAMLKELERFIAQGESVPEAALDLGIRREIFDRCARFDQWLTTIQLLAVSTLTQAVDEVREILQVVRRLRCHPRPQRGTVALEYGSFLVILCMIERQARELRAQR